MENKSQKMFYGHNTVKVQNKTLSTHKIQICVKLVLGKCHGFNASLIK